MGAKESHWNDLETRIQENLAAAPTVINLNVGGTRFTVPKQTLLAVEGSYFYVMLGGGHWKPDGPNDAYFLDLNPSVFGRVIAFLRTGKLSFDGLNSWEDDQLRETLDYLKLETAKGIMPWSWDPNTCHPAIAISTGNKTITSACRGHQYKSVLGDAPVSEFRVQVNKFGSFYVGFTQRSCFDTATLNQGYYLGVVNNFTSLWLVVTSGDIVTARVSDGKVHFGVNDHALKEAFVVANPAHALFPVVTFCNECSISIVE
ncbi:Aste57867_15181 [Aphanomyces stellatus]|uniref:Aste57867_15181 protein n=1 Tax=Aphanomyces stellatus TaxID=120398 RepID=A0A485L3D2_9STRA|nr:hypothetical protein As57867_015125 [Aphanomyces stellatus]VFT91990.1 Aste57867_15181 [Aphanomyces stellatus]